MSQRQDDFEELLRRALHSAADSVEPSEDGLERIRARLTSPHPLPVAWVMAAYPEAARRALGGLHSVAAWLQTVFGTGHERFAQPGAPHQRRLARVRLAAALVAVAVVMALSVSAVNPLLRQAVSLASGLIHSADGGLAGTGQPAGSG